MKAPGCSGKALKIAVLNLKINESLSGCSLVCQIEMPRLLGKDPWGQAPNESGSIASHRMDCRPVPRPPDVAMDTHAIVKKWHG
jgi:hypothetical protein